MQFLRTLYIRVNMETTTSTKKNLKFLFYFFSFFRFQIHNEDMTTKTIYVTGWEIKLGRAHTYFLVVIVVELDQFFQIVKKTEWQAQQQLRGEELCREIVKLLLVIKYKVK